MSQKQYAYFSGAMYAGIRAYPNDIHGKWADDLGGTCAIGAGLIMASERPLHSDFALNAYPYLAETKADCPLCAFQGHLFDVAHHLYEGQHKLTRIAVADWLYTEEEKLGFVTLTEEASAIPAPDECFVAAKC